MSIHESVKIYKLLRLYKISLAAAWLWEIFKKTAFERTVKGCSSRTWYACFTQYPLYSILSSAFSKFRIKSIFDAPTKKEHPIGYSVFGADDIFCLWQGVAAPICAALVFIFVCGRSSRKPATICKLPQTVIRATQKTHPQGCVRIVPMKVTNPNLFITSKHLKIVAFITE